MKKIIILIVFLFAVAGCARDAFENNVTLNIEPLEIIAIGEGETAFRLNITDDKNNLTAWEISTNETTVGAALLGVAMIAGEETSIGLMVTMVNGVPSTFNVDGSWWAFYIDGEMAESGVCSTEINTESLYAFVFTS